MVCYAWDVLELSEKTQVDADSYEQDADLLATLLITGFNYQKKRGLIKNYIPKSEELSLIKGKINFSNSMKKSSFHRAKAICDYDDYGLDVLPNQVIKSALHKLLRTNNLNHDIAVEVRDLIKQLSEVSDITEYSEHCFRSIKIPRNFQYYKYLLSISEFVIKNLSQNEHTGKFEFTDFVREPKKLAALYEKFIRNFYKRNLSSEYKVGNTSQERYVGLNTITNESKYVPTLNTDIELKSKTSDDLIIIDTKFSYKTLDINPFGDAKIHSKYLMQLMTYLENRRRKTSVVASGMLLYPTVGNHYEFTNKIWDYNVSIFNIDLNKEWKEIHNELIQIITKHLEYKPESDIEQKEVA